MNIQAIFDALEEDDQNSALGIIVSELEAQGYNVQIDQTAVDSQGFFEGKYADLENKMEPLDIALFRSDALEQQFSIEFIDFHDFVLKRKCD